MLFYLWIFSWLLPYRNSQTKSWALFEVHFFIVLNYTMFYINWKNFYRMLISFISYNAFPVCACCVGLLNKIKLIRFKKKTFICVSTSTQPNHVGSPNIMSKYIAFVSLNSSRLNCSLNLTLTKTRVDWSIKRKYNDKRLIVTVI